MRWIEGRERGREREGDREGERGGGEKEERSHLTPPPVAMTAGCVGMCWIWHCPHPWHQGTLGYLCARACVRVSMCVRVHVHACVPMNVKFNLFISLELSVFWLELKK